MISVEEAHTIITKHAKDYGVEEIPLQQATSRVLREPVVADRPFPPYDRVTMDGIAIRYADFKRGTTSFSVEGVAAAGAEQQGSNGTNECLEVMTGAIMPEGLDTVIPYEQIRIDKETATLQTEDINHRQNIHFCGSDRQQGDVIIQPGKRLSASEIGVCATIGKTMVKVSRLPKAIVISSGDELVSIEEQPATHQIRKSNVYWLQTALRNQQIHVSADHLPDNYEAIVDRLRTHLETYDLIILSGGVSKGKFDYLPDALKELDVEQHFHRIAQRPGKPFWFGSKAETTVFAFPGNPVSSFVCMHVYLTPWLERCTRLEPRALPIAVLGEDVVFKRDLTYFLEVKLSYSKEGQLIANPVKGNGSGDLANLVDADAFIQLPQGKDAFRKGEAYPIVQYR